MTSPGQRSTRSHANTISSEAALVGALAAFAKSPSSSSTVHRTSGQFKDNTGRRTVSYTPRSTSINQSPVQNGPHQICHTFTGGAGDIDGLGRTGRNTLDRRARVPLSDPNSTVVISKQRPSQVPGNISKPLPNPKPRVLTADKLAANSPEQVMSKKDHEGKPNEERIPSTSSLVQLFETKGETLHIEKPTITVNSPPPVDSPRFVGRLHSSEEAASERVPVQEILERLEARPSVVLAPGGDADPISSPDSFVSATDSLTPNHPEVPKLSAKPVLPPPRRSTAARSSSPPKVGVRKISNSSMLEPSDPILVRRGSSHNGLYSVPLAASSSQSITAQYHQLHPRRLSALKTGDSLANALVASSLASSRAPSPTRPPLLPHPQARSHRNLFKSRTPSPAKKAGFLRQTMRKDTSSPSSSDNEGDPYGKHKKKRHIRKHPNKHNEGDRKRWRNAVTERERKRYEGLWAANKGTLCAYTESEQRLLASSFAEHNDANIQDIRDAVAEQVADIVVRDIWTRSRLPQHVLQEVWDLVDTQGVRRLTREEFVVGLWLIDQRLKGRKLPMRVSESVWHSVKLLQGIKIRTK